MNQDLVGILLSACSHNPARSGKRWKILRKRGHGRRENEKDGNETYLEGKVWRLVPSVLLCV